MASIKPSKVPWDYLHLELRQCIIDDVMTSAISHFEPHGIHTLYPDLPKICRLTAFSRPFGIITSVFSKEDCSYSCKSICKEWDGIVQYLQQVIDTSKLTGRDGDLEIFGYADICEVMKRDLQRRIEEVTEYLEEEEDFTEAELLFILGESMMAAGDHRRQSNCPIVNNGEAPVQTVEPANQTDQTHSAEDLEPADR